ncbi:hypothetical protein [Methylomagnum sp.]
MNMEKYLAAALFLASCAMTLQTEAQASTLTGTVQMIRVNAGSGESVRVGVQISGDTDCPLNNWFAFERADTGVSKLWLDLATTAFQTGKQLTITGTGACDEWDIEGVSNIDLHS